MLTFKTAIGIAVLGDDLEFVCLKRGLSGTTESGRTRLANFRAMPAPASVAAYQDFLGLCGLAHANVSVALPRRDVLLRTLTLPAEAARTLDKAVEYQVDSLHPFEEGGVDFAHSILHQDDRHVLVAVAMVEKGIASSYYDWFAQAGIPVAAFTASPAVLYGGFAESAPVFVISRSGETSELLGISRDALVSREVQTEHLDRELQLARAELRLPAEAEIASIEQPDLAYLTALSSLSKRPFAINLLPPARRAYESPWRHATTYALAGVVALLVIALAGRGEVQDRIYLRRVNNEIKALEPKIKLMEKLDSKEGRELTRLMTLHELKDRTPTRLQILAEITRVLPSNVYLTEAQIGSDGITLQGVTDSASGVLALLANSPSFKSPEFLNPILKTNEGKEQFRVHVQWAGGKS